MILCETPKRKKTDQQRSYKPGTLLLKPFSSALISVTLLIASAQANAHFFAENNNCRPPKKPLQFVTELDKQKFDEKVNDYRSCLETFVNKQNSAMTKHKESAEKAAAVWKQYAENVLQVKVISAEEAEAAKNNTEQPKK
ncbi:hypothetical protein BGP75_25745 [Motiliproteus sp. MSK22-1]|nr:hypothetical protein BGP75_25745 [Motiliproteus sp. MSK22-1]